MSRLRHAFAKWRQRRACLRGNHSWTAVVGRIGRCQRCGHLR